MNKAAVEILSSGYLMTLQDLGRYGKQRFGVSVSGAMDKESLILGNRLVGNPPGTAALEITLGEARLRFSSRVWIAVTGADLEPRLNGLRISNWVSMQAPADSILEFGSAKSGTRAYLCVSDGFDTVKVLGSRSTHVPSGVGPGRLMPGDVLYIAGRPHDFIMSHFTVDRNVVPKYESRIVLRVIPGPQENVFSSKGIDTFYSSEYEITTYSDRQGFRLQGPPIESTTGSYDIISDAVALGSVQVTGEGQPIILMADRQPTGGYAKIGVVASFDIPLVAQTLPGSTIMFKRITLEQAQKLAAIRKRELLHTPLIRYHPIRKEVKVEGEQIQVSVNCKEDMVFSTAEVEDVIYDVHIRRW